MESFPGWKRIRVNRFDTHEALKLDNLRSMGHEKIQSGKRAEKMALSFLKRVGYSLIKKNFRYKRSEIDLIVSKGDWLVFVEVKFRANLSFGHGYESISSRQEELIKEGANAFLIDEPWSGPIRFDIISICPINKGYDITHLKDAF